MRRLSAVFVLIMLAPAVAIGQRPLSTVARAVADREASLRKRIAAAPTDPAAYFELAELQQEFEVFSDAVATLSQARRALPANKEVPLKLAGVYYRLRQFEQTLAMFDLAAGLDPADPAIRTRARRTTTSSCGMM